MPRIITFALLIIIALNATKAFADPVSWTLQGVTTGDGGSISGSFTYDADTDTHSSVNISVSGSSFSGANTTYTFPLGSDSNTLNATPIDCTASNCTGQPYLRLNTVTSLTNAGGSIDLDNRLAYFTCTNSACIFQSSSGSSGVTAGSVVGSPAPAPPQVVTEAIPATTSTGLALALIGLLLAGIGHLRRHRGAVGSP